MMFIDLLEVLKYSSTLEELFLGSGIKRSSYSVSKVFG